MPYKITYSKLKILKDCRLCFWWDVKHGIERPDTIMSQLPNRIDERLKETFDLFRQQMRVPPILVWENIELFPNQELVSLWRDKNNGAVHTDENFMLKAVPDEVLQKNGKLVVLDFKTAGANPENCTEEKLMESIEDYEYKLQLEFYNYVLRKMGYETKDYGYFLFYFLDNFHVEGASSFGKKLIKINLDIPSVQKLLDDVAELLGKEEKPECKIHKNGEMCRYCNSPEERYNKYVKGQENLQELLDAMLKN